METSHADHVSPRKNFKSAGLHRERYTFYMYDHATDTEDTPPLKKKYADLAEYDIKYFIGDHKSKSLYNDGSKELKTAPKNLKLIHISSTPYHPQSFKD